MKTNRSLAESLLSINLFRKIFFLILFVFGSAYAQQPKNLSLLGVLQFPGQTAAGCWHYNNTAGEEYALVGTENGISIVDITDPANPALLFQLPGVNSLWHEVKVTGDYAYAVSEGSDTNGILNGLQIINLSYLPDSAPFKFYQGDAAIANQLISSHTVTTEGNRVFLNGHNISGLGRGVIILDITDPWFPTYIGSITNRYCHDSYIRGNTIYTSDILDGLFSVYDITNPSSPINVATQQTPGQFNHNTWLSDDGRIIFTTDERSGQPLASYDISDLNNITELDTFYNGNLSNNEVHNVRVINDFLINPSYGSQLTIADASRPQNIIETGSYITGSSLCWDADPYLASGNIIATDMNSGKLYIFKPDYIRACYLEGIVTDSVTGFPLNNVSVFIQSASITETTNGIGEYRTGYADSGMYVVSFSKTGYITRNIAVLLQNGVLNNLDVKLVPVNAAVSDLSDNNLLVYPNPSTGPIKVVENNRKIQSWTLMDVVGKVVCRSESDFMLTNSISINLNELSPANYLLQVVFSDGGIESTLIRKF